MAISFRPFQRSQKPARRPRSSALNARRSAPSESKRDRASLGRATPFRPASTASTVVPFRRPRLNIAVPRSRLLIVWLILMAGMLALMVNLLRLQIFDADMLQARAKAQQTVLLSAAVPRRSIIDREGNVLAIDKPVYTLYAHPILFQQQKETIAVALAPILKKSLEQMQQILNQGDSGLRLADNLPEETANELRRLQLDGLELLQQQERLYPQQELFANIVGYVNVDRQGQAGLEYSEEAQLARPLPETEISRSGDGSVMPDGISKDFAQHDDLQLKLTLDSRLQRATRYALKQQTDKYGAKRGVAIVMDVNDGSILALASEPSFDANKYYKTDQETLRDWVVTDVYEPGSTFKPINIAIALEAGAVKPKDRFFDEGAIQIGEWPIQNNDYDSVGARGDISVSQILEYSSNVGMVHVMQRVNPGVFYGWLEKIKLGEPTGIDLPFEALGQIKKYAQFTSARIEPATTAFGQGFSLTPVKLIQLHSMIANGGKLVTPHVVEGLIDSEGKLKWQPDHPKPKAVLTPKTTNAVLEMMEQVVQEGTGTPAQIAGYRIAGKTGTAQKASQAGGYSHARITSFIGILPVEAPRYAVLAVVDEPQGDDAYGSTVAAPIVKSVMEALIATERIPPTKPEAIGTDEPVGSLPADLLRETIDFHNQINQSEPKPAGSPPGDAAPPTLADPAAIAEGQADDSADTAQPGAIENPAP
jgi:cell division protein FtsI (penicillin-binding protein 3)